MSALQVVFVAALTALLLGVVLFSAFTVRAALVVRPTTARGSWLVRIGRASNRDVQRWAFVAHRATGVAVFAFLLLHVFDVALFTLSPARFDDVHELYGTAPMRVFECLLFFAILFHTFNGLRLVLLDVAEIRLSTARRLLHVAVALTAVAGTAASVVILKPVVA
ncbi:MAG: succinate dehydrogenase, cytochrome b556 subunit [Gaiellaceae bacterium MAG52_C11]|nr:succinate dehydrogenase, cytochrome b556 subunit [Candidatus Gaiellasilicea maunaloa]